MNNQKKIYCKYCGKKIDIDSVFCQYCGKSQSATMEHITEKEPIVESAISTDTRFIKEKQSYTDVNEEYENKAVSNVDESKQNDNKDSSDLTFSDFILQKIGYICGLIFLAFILLGILTAIRQFSKEWLGNSSLYWTTIDILIGVVFFFIVRHLRGKKLKEHFESIAFTIVVIVIIIISIVGRVITSQKERKTPVENTIDMNTIKQIEDNNKLKEIVQKANLALPETVDEYTTWTNIRIEGNVVILTYRLYDEGFDLFDIDVVEYKKEIEENILSHNDKRFLNLCAETNKEIKIRIVSQWDSSKSFEILFGNLEVKDLANR